MRGGWRLREEGGGGRGEGGEENGGEGRNDNDREKWGGVAI